MGGLFGGLARPDPVERAAMRTGWLLGGPIYVAGTLSTLDLMHGLPHGGSWVLLSMFLAWMSDTVAYFAGKYLGRHKLYPKLSPKKTVEGAMGGLVGSMIGAVIVSLWLIPGFPLTHALGLAVVAGALGQAGDLFESLIKRSTGVKDSGRILPGHGGLLDRVDALMFTASATFLYASTLYPGQ
jgi:phosphatidate cytidylyltransferase